MSERSTPRPGSQGRAADESFYASALTEAERPTFEQSLKVEGLDEEIALLRLRLRGAVSERGEDEFKLMQGGVRLLVQALLARHRLSPKQAENLSEAMTNVLEEFGEVLREAGHEDG